MLGRQLDLFFGHPGSLRQTARPLMSSRLVPENLDDSALVEALPEARVVDCHALCAVKRVGENHRLPSPRAQALVGASRASASSIRCRSRSRHCAVWQRSARGRRLRPSRASSPKAWFRVPACTMQSTPRSSSNVACRPPRCPFYGTTMHGLRRRLSRGPTTCRHNASVGRLAG